jgi:alpha-glucosidase
LHLGQHQGAFHPWWNQIAVDVYGWDARTAEVTLAHGGSDAPHASIDSARHVVSFTVTDDGQGIDLQVRGSY